MTPFKTSILLVHLDLDPGEEKTVLQLQNTLAVPLDERLIELGGEIDHLRDLPQQAEIFVSKFLDEIDKDPTQSQITLDGEIYDLNDTKTYRTLNNRLRDSDSTKRVLISAGEGYLYGEIDSETRIKAGNREVTLINIHLITRLERFGHAFLALNTNDDFIFTVQPHIQNALKRAEQHPNISAHYKKTADEFVLSKVKTMDQTEAGGLAQELVAAHELGHYDMVNQHGEEYRYLRQYLGHTEQADDLVILEELYADLHAVEHILTMAENDIEKATKALYVWKAIRGPQVEGKKHTHFEECISNLLLSGLNDNGEVNFNVLRKNTSSLKQLTTQFYREVTTNLKLDLLGFVYGVNTQGKEQNTPWIHETYNNIRNRIANAQWEEDTSQDGKMIQRTLLANSIKELFKKVPHLVGSFAGDSIQTEYKIDQWTRDLGITQTPFRLPANMQFIQGE